MGYSSRMKAITPSQAGAALGRVSSTKKSAAARANGAKGGRPRVFAVRASDVRRVGAHKPVTSVTVVPSVDGFPGTSDEVTLQPGQWLEIVLHGSPCSWSKAVVRP